MSQLLQLCVLASHTSSARALLASEPSARHVARAKVRKAGRAAVTRRRPTSLRGADDFGVLDHRRLLGERFEVSAAALPEPLLVESVARIADARELVDEVHAAYDLAERREVVAWIGEPVVLFIVDEHLRRVRVGARLRECERAALERVVA